MIRGFLLILKPLDSWTVLKEAQRGVFFVLVIHLLPLLIVTAAVEAMGMTAWGEWQGGFRHLKRFAPGEAAVFAAGQVLLSLVVVFIGALLLKWVATTFHSRHNFSSAFTLVAYALSPLFLARMVNAFPAVSEWVTWAVGVFFALSLLYNGLPLILEPDPPQAFGLFVMTATLLVLLTGLANLLTWYFLRGNFSALNEVVTRLGRQLPW